jgi:hypothetical protein
MPKRWSEVRTLESGSENDCFLAQREHDTGSIDVRKPFNSILGGGWI